MPKVIGKTGSGPKRSSGALSRPFHATDHLKTGAERAAYLEALLGDGDNRVITSIQFVSARFAMPWLFFEPVVQPVE